MNHPKGKCCLRSEERSEATFESIKLIANSIYNQESQLALESTHFCFQYNTTNIASSNHLNRVNLDRDRLQTLMSLSGMNIFTLS